MKLKSLLLSLLLIMVTTVASAQVEDGKAYRIVNGKYGTVISASPITHELSCVAEGVDTDYQQMWLFEKQSDGRFFIQNVFTRRYLQNETGTNVAFRTGNEKVAFAINANSSLKGFYNIDASSRSGGWGLHCASGATVVPWSYGPVDGEVSGSEWQFEAVSIGEAEFDKAYEEYSLFLATVDRIDEIEVEAVKFFQDKACTVLKSEYASMSDADLTAAMSQLPADLQAAILKIKNNTWDTTVREKDFRIYEYKPYSNPETWANNLFLRPFNRINNPTGIYTESDREFIYVFVDEIPAGTTMSLAQMQSTKYFGVDNDLHVGLNVIPSAYKNGTVFLRYVCETAIGGKKLADYPRVKVHIENGRVNGFWSKERGHTNADWKYMQENMFGNPESVIAVGDLTMLNFRKAEFLEPYKGYDAWGYKIEGCHTDIEGVMALWDFWNTSQQKNMALDRYWEYFNNKQLAMSDDGGFMDAGSYRTHYNNNTLNTIVNYDRITRDAGSAWGPNHEIGHTNQYAFQIVGTSEVSNNALSNFSIFEVGTHTSRGNNLENQILDFENKVPYVVRGEKAYDQKLFSMTRMYFQLYLYFHAAGKKPDFYPSLFEELRKDRLVGWVTSSNRNLETDKNGYILGSMDAKYDQLKFVEKCCEVAQMDLSEFFEAWGFFIPMKNAFVGDYGHHHVYLHQSSIDSCLAKIKQYEKKGGHLMFIEDRVRPSRKMKSAVNNDDSGYRGDYSNEVPVGASTGLFGQWEDYIDESVKATGYYYAISGGKVEIMEADGAKGALGFKLYDADNNKLLTYTNKKSMNIPLASRNATLKVVAAQADGTDYVVPHASKGPESMQLTALEKSLDAAKKAVARKAKDGNEIGYFHADSIATLEAMYNEAQNAYDKKATDKYSYAEWSVMLDSEIARLNADPANRIELEENMTAYFVQTGSYRGQALAYDAQCLLSHTGNYTTDPNMAWTIEYAGKEGEYYLKNGTGFYIKNFDMNGLVYADVTSPVAAAKFNVGYTDGGKIFFTLVGNPSLSFGVNNSRQFDGNNSIAGMNANEAEAQWRGYVIEDNSAEFYKQELGDALNKASFMITEIINLDSLNSMNIFNDGIMVLDRNLETYAVALLDTYNKIMKDKDNAAKCKSYLTELRNLFNTIEGTYVVTAPIATKGKTVVWYRIISKETGKYLTVKDGSSARNKNRLAVVNAKDVDDNCLWSFASAGKGEYRLYNAGKESFMYRNPDYSRYMYVSAEEITHVSVVFSNDAKGLAIHVEDQALDEGSSNVDLTDAEVNSTFWELELVSIETNKSMANIITTIEKVLPAGDVNGEMYDLNGRRVVNPTTGIYIQNGQKVLVK